MNEDKYKEALERARQWEREHPNGYVLSEMWGYVFPELAESEDERIRKVLVELVEAQPAKEFIGDVSKDDCLAYLEKQKELFKSGRGLYYYDGEKTTYCGHPATEENPYDFAISQQEKQKEQKPISSCDIVPYIDDKIAALQDMWREEKVAFDWDDVHEMIEDVARHFYQKDQIPYTDFVIKPHKGDDNNPYDMRVSEAQEYAIKRGFGIPFNDGEVYVDERHLTQTIGNILRWADEHPKEQKPAEWSEEDEKKIHFLSRLIEFQVKDDEYFFGDGSLISKQEAIEMLKSLRPSWKPSDEQMEALHYVKQFDYGGHKAALVSLYEQLRKLWV